MRWHDKPHTGRLYRWLYRAWFGSWNLNHDLQPVRKRVHITRPVLYNSAGRVRVPYAYAIFIAWFIFLLVVAAPIIAFMDGL